MAPPACNPARCPLCGEPNQCALAGGNANQPCWCSGVRIARETLARIPSACQGLACICPQCAGEHRPATTLRAARAPASIGVFDSGVGGLTVLRALHAQLPGVPLIYVADSAHAPYGDQSDAFILERSRQISRFLIEAGARLIVVACNTATAAAIAALRAEFEMPFVGIEPGIKPALARSHNQRVGVMATPSTLRSAKFRALLNAHAAQAVPVLQPCPGLADAVERGDLQAPDLQELVRQSCAPLRAADCDTVVLGCTHYPLIAAHIQTELGPQVHLLDTAEPVARQAARLWTHGAQSATAAPQIYTNGEIAVLRRMATLCGLDDAQVHNWPASIALSAAQPNP
ncbi:MAG: glutamate racemase [Burkholderiaceae bacterium]|nr:glutamate racemase [Burkholderiaceae bacterium]